MILHLSSIYFFLGFLIGIFLSYFDIDININDEDEEDIDEVTEEKQEEHSKHS